LSRFLLGALWVVGALLLSQGVYMDAKAKLAQILIASSWQQRAADRPPPKPWWWADTRAIAKLEIPRLEKTVFVMQDASGESLAFGPGHMQGSAAPAQSGHVMVAGHRDSHFEFLKDIEIGDVIETTDYKSSHKRYRVVETLVIDSNQESVELASSNFLTLVTCYPFNGIAPNTSLRYLVNAQELTQPR
jgi:sortase A